MAAALNVLGDKWSLLVIRELLYGVRRFDRIVAFTGGARNIITDRLRKLEDAGCVTRRQYSARPVRYEYLPTQAASDLLPALMAIAQWGGTWGDARGGGTCFQHACGAPLPTVVACTHCGQPIVGASIVPVEAADPPRRARSRQPSSKAPRR